MKLVALIFLSILGGISSLSASETNLVANGSFDQMQNESGLPDFWSTAGNPAIKQQLRVDTGPDGKRCARLSCTESNGDGPDFHAMLCQIGKVSVRQGHWYRLSFGAKAQGIRGGAVEVGLSNTRPWQNAGLAEAFSPGSQWGHFEFLFRAAIDLPASSSRLQFWFKSTGTLWLEGVVLAESAEGQQWFPQIATAQVKNFIPNSSFECGTANWGSFTYGLKGWAGNLYRLEGQWDDQAASHGRHSLKISITPKTTPVFYFDYYDPVRQPVRRILAANQGWFPVKPGEPLTLSAFLRADRDAVPAQLAFIEAPENAHQKEVRVGTQWQRYEFTFKPIERFLFIALGPDLGDSKLESATLWVDAVQLERGEHATPYEPRQPLESFIETTAPGNIFTNPAAGLTITLRAYNDSERAATLRGNLELTDFFDRRAFAAERRLHVPAHGERSRAWAHLCSGRQGFFRANWTAVPSRSLEPRAQSSSLSFSNGTVLSQTQSLRCGLILPANNDLADSALGFNHAYPWDFLVQRARQAGIVWWRDWSAKWQTIEPEPGRFDFTAADTQIQRLFALDGQVEVLLPFPSALWSTTARADEVQKAAGKNQSLRTRLPVAFAPRDLKAFGDYALKVARHYDRRKVTYIQVLNEPVYTDYALPRQFGYSLGDYLHFLETAAKALRAEGQCRVVGGISAGLEAGLTQDFVAQGGLRWLDVFDLHMYDPARPAESFEDSFSFLEHLMNEHGGPKPVWITEWGCYADDDPACAPPSVGDATMNRCRWPSERAATEHIVKFTAVAFAHGVRKIFFHAGTCGTINGPDAAGVLFEYGGTPRKMYCGVATLTRLLGVPDRCISQIVHEGTRVYSFESAGRVVSIAWAAPEHPARLKLGPTVKACDMMGNELPGGSVQLGPSPVYLVGESKETVLSE